MKLKNKYKDTIAWRDGRYYVFDRLTQDEMKELIKSNPKYEAYFEDDENEDEDQ